MIHDNNAFVLKPLLKVLPQRSSENVQRVLKVTSGNAVLLSCLGLKRSELFHVVLVQNSEGTQSEGCSLYNYQHCLYFSI